MDELLLNPQTKARLLQVLARRPHAVLLTGSLGCGAEVCAKQLAQLLAPHMNPVIQESLTVGPLNNSIGVDQVRDITKKLSIKMPGLEATRQVVIINQADSMTPEAQNALLKALEEPPSGTCFLLTAAADQKILPTIASRVQKVHVRPVSYDSALAYFTPQGYSENTISQAYALSGGASELMAALLNEDTHPLKQAITDSKRLLALPVHARLVEVNTLAKNGDITYFLEALKRILRAATLKTDDNKGTAAVSPRMIERLKLVHEAEASLSSNPNSKLLLTHLLINL